MSGGSFDYKCFQINEFADELKQMLLYPNISLNSTHWASKRKFEFKETLGLLKKCQKIIELAGKLAYNVEWFFSDDYGEETFIEYIKKELKLYGKLK